MSPETPFQRFVRGLLAGGAAVRDGYVSPDGRHAKAEAVARLIQAGALGGDEDSCFAVAETASWLKRARLDADAFAAQHRETVRGVTGTQINVAESPLARLATASGGEAAFLDRHHFEAGERVRRMFERAQLPPRLTMSYSASRTAGNRPQAAADLSDLAAEARRDVAAIHRLLPRDCASVVMDVCGLLKGLQDVERDRGWPRRSAKLVLRIGLDHLAQHYGIGPFAVGRESNRRRAWMGDDARPERFE